MLIEKIYKKKHKEDITDYDYYDAPGIVNVFLGCRGPQYQRFFVKDVPQYFEKPVVETLAKHGIYLGKQYGREGLEIDELWAAQYDPDTIFEICGNTFRGLSALQRRQLRKHPVMVYEYAESDMSMRDVDLTGFITAGSNLSQFDISIPMFAYGTVASSKERGYTGSTVPKIDRSVRKILFPVHKPRPERLNIFESLEQSGLLDDTTWSLYLSKNTEARAYDFNASPNVGTERWIAALEHPFMKRHWHEIPKKLDEIEWTSQCVPLHKDYNGYYTWHIASETYCESTHFPTEKTFKAMIGGHQLLTYSLPGYNTLLESRGFKMIGDYDHLGGQDRIDAIVDIIKHDHTDYSHITEHNFNLLNDTKFMCNLLLTELIKLRKLLS